MTLPSSGTITLGQVNTELGLSASAQISLNDGMVRAMCGKLSGAIALSDLWGKSAGWSIVVGGLSSNIATKKYHHSDNTITAGRALGTSRFNLAASGNYTLGLFSGGCLSSTTNTSTVVERYTYAGDGVTSGTSLSGSEVTTTACGTQTYGIIAQGRLTSKYTYGDNTNVASTTLVKDQVYGAVGVANATYGLFGGGAQYSAVAVNVFTFSNSATSYGENLDSVKNRAGAAGNTIICIFGAGADRVDTPVASTAKYNFSAQIGFGGTALGAARWEVCASGDVTFGLFFGGNNSDTDRVDKYTFSNDTVTTATSLGQTKRGGGTTSTKPGGF